MRPGLIEILMKEKEAVLNPLSKDPAPEGPALTAPRRGGVYGGQTGILEGWNGGILGNRNQS